MSAVSVEGVLRAFAHYNISVSSFIISLLETPAYQSLLSVIDLTSNIEHILAAFVSNSRAYRSTLRCASNLIKRTYARSISELAKRENGWHFSALRASAKQLEAFRLEEMARDMERLAPELWELLDTMLSADHKESSGPRNVRPHRNSMPTEEEDYWNQVDEVELGDAEVQGDEEPRDRKCEREERRKALNNMTEKGYYNQYLDAKHESEMQCVRKCYGHLPAFVQHTRKSDTRSCSNGHLGFCERDTRRYPIVVTRDIPHDDIGRPHSS